MCNTEGCPSHGLYFYGIQPKLASGKYADKWPEGVLEYSDGTPRKFGIKDVKVTP